MIRFALRCAGGHQFESWFQNGSAFDSQAAAGLVSCPVCQSSAVSKAIMAPSLARRDREEVCAVGQQAPAEASPEASAPVPMFNAADGEVRKMVVELRKRILETSDDLGPKFAEEALKIHHGLVPDRPIHGQASFEEARTLIEEGVKIMPLPRLPGEMN